MFRLSSNKKGSLKDFHVQRVRGQGHICTGVNAKMARTYILTARR